MLAVTEEEWDRKVREVLRDRGEHLFFAVVVVAVFGGGTAFSVFLWWFGL